MNEFVWADLSTYNTKKSKAFYESVFGWQFHDAGNYLVALQGTEETAGLYETPDFFKQIKMPHFWMSYVAVENAETTAQAAREFGSAKVELSDDFYGGRIALIRDPQGAGFTVYDGGRLNGRKSQPGNLIWNELHVSDAANAIPFYETLFDWTVMPAASDGRYRVINSAQQHVTDIVEVPNKLKGKHEYWVCTFGVKSLNQTKQSVVEHGGSVILDEGDRVMLSDNSVEAFFYIQCIN